MSTPHSAYSTELSTRQPLFSLGAGLSLLEEQSVPHSRQRNILISYFIIRTIRSLLGNTESGRPGFGGSS